MLLEIFLAVVLARQRLVLSPQLLVAAPTTTLLPLSLYTTLSYSSLQLSVFS